MYTMLGCNASQWYWSTVTHIANHYEKIWRFYGTPCFTIGPRFEMVSSTRLQVTFHSHINQFDFGGRCGNDSKFYQADIALIKHSHLFVSSPLYALVMLLSPLDVHRVRESNANDLAVMLTFATIVKPNGIRIKRAMLHVHRGKVRCEHHREVSVKIHSIAPMTSNHAHAVKCWSLKWMTAHAITWCARFVAPSSVGFAWKR